MLHLSEWVSAPHTWDEADRLICWSRTRFHHGVVQLPDTQITPDKAYFHSVCVAGEFLLSFLPHTKPIILAIKRIVPPPQRLIQSLIISRDAFSRCTARCPWLAQIASPLHVRAYALFEVFHQNEASNKKGRTPASHHRHRPYCNKQDIDVSSRDGCVIFVLGCLCVYQTRSKITMTVTTPNDLDSSTCWDGKRSSTGALHVWFINQLRFGLSGESSVVYKLCILILSFLLGQRRLWNEKMEHRIRCNCPTSYEPLSRDWLEGQLDTYMTVTPTMTSASWNDKTFAFSTRIGLKGQVVRWLCLYRTSLNLDSPVQIGPSTGTIAATLPHSRVMYNYIWPFSLQVHFKRPLNGTLSLLGLSWL